MGRDKENRLWGTEFINPAHAKKTQSPGASEILANRERACEVKGGDHLEKRGRKELTCGSAAAAEHTQPLPRRQGQAAPSGAPALLSAPSSASLAPTYLLPFRRVHQNNEHQQANVGRCQALSYLILTNNSIITTTLYTRGGDFETRQLA